MINQNKKEKASLETLKIAFGASSLTYRYAIAEFAHYYPTAKAAPALQSNQARWENCLKIAYGSFSGSDAVFWTHSYLSMLAKLLAFRFLSNNDGALEPANLQIVLNGVWFVRHGFTNFTESDIYAWLAEDAHFSALSPVAERIIERLGEFDFQDTDEDILKGVYQELIALETRHALGEYYTPDWLCEMLSEGLGFRRGMRILDPSCGSGSFLRAAIAELIKITPDITAEELCESVTGIDIHPLSVQIAKTTLLLAMGKKARLAEKKLSFNIYLANALTLPETVSLDASEGIPLFANTRFDRIIGNPPWVVYNVVNYAKYQKLLLYLAEKYCLRPKANLITHLEIAAIFMAHSGFNFLEKDGKMGFVLPRSFLSADQHENTRLGKAIGFRLTEIWDLEKVAPLFKIPSCVLLADAKPDDQNTCDTELQEQSSEKQIVGNTIVGKQISGKLPLPNGIVANLTLAKASPYLKIKNEPYTLAYLANPCAYRTSSASVRAFSLAQNAYKDVFNEGASLVPRSFYFVDLPLDYEPKTAARHLCVETSQEAMREGKKPWNEISFHGIMPTQYLFRTALARCLVPFAVMNLPMVTLPIEVLPDNSLAMLNLAALQEKEDKYALSWFSKAEEYWNSNKTGLAKSWSIIDRLNFQRLLTKQKINTNYIVLYNLSGKDANAAILDPSILDRPFVGDSSCVIARIPTFEEACYLVMFLNCSFANELMKPFQTRGLFGPRAVAKKILDAPLPRYEASDHRHASLANLGKICIDKSAIFVQGSPEPTKYGLGKYRLEIRKYLSQELEQGDKLLIEISESL